MNWKPNAFEKRALRQAAAQQAGLKPTQIALKPGMRSGPVGNEASFNDWAWGKDATTDLYDNSYGMKDFERCGGAELNADGEAYVDFYVYQLGNNGYGIEPVELVCNVGAIIELVDGKPKMRMIDTGWGTVAVMKGENA